MSNKVRCHHRRPPRRFLSIILNQRGSELRVLTVADRTKNYKSASSNVLFFFFFFLPGLSISTRLEYCVANLNAALARLARSVSESGEKSRVV